MPGPHRPEQKPDNHVEAEEPEVPAMLFPPPGERVVVPRGPQGHRQPNRDWRGVWRSVQCKVAGEMKYDPNPGGKYKPPHWILRVRMTDGGLLARFCNLLELSYLYSRQVKLAVKLSHLTGHWRRVVPPRTLSLQARGFQHVRRGRQRSDQRPPRG